MKAYVINLPGRPERLDRFLGWNGGHGLDFQVVPAVVGAGQDRAALVAQGILDADNAAFSDGAVGNALSHRAQWLACVEDGGPRLVCEDDACLHATFAAQLPHLLRGLEGCDILFFGYNTDAPVTVLLPDGMVSELYFGLIDERGPDFYRRFAASTAPRARSVLHPAVTVWGSMAYVVTPAGARRLLETCFPLSLTAGRVQHYFERRQLLPAALDGMINVAMQQGRARGRLVFPPLALSPNDLSDVCPRPSQD